MATELTIFESGFKDEAGNIITRADLQHVIMVNGTGLTKEDLEKKVCELVGKNKEGYYVAQKNSGFYIVYRRGKLK